ncbi:hypothetical protein H0H93_016899 [Arthromyces matolae]|nr:hypothetical protein H0H93_016899 [Arthromyces matolae]
MMVNAWTSAINCARIYNEGLTGHRFSPTLPISYPKSLQLSVEDVWNGLFLYWLLSDCKENGIRLELEHGASSQALCLEPSLSARNLRMSGPGQDEWSHACDDCCWINDDDPSNPLCLRSVVVDGTDVKRITCEVHDCTNKLNSLRDFFCPDHQHLARYCVITSCKVIAQEGRRTCSDHQKIEDYKNQKNKAMFQLKHRLMHLQNTLPNAEFGSNDFNQDDDDEDDEEDDALCDGKADTGNQPRRARFSHRLTHNEELCVASCGVILGRATFFGSEAPNGVRMFLMGLFPTKRSLPGVIWHDNNCRIRAMLENDDDSYLRSYFDNSALPVDVFHFKSKHKETDIDCGKYCNPALWPELKAEDGNWRAQAQIEGTI